MDYEDLKILTLNYDDGDTEEFELSVINDGTIDFIIMNRKQHTSFLEEDFYNI